MKPHSHVILVMELVLVLVIFISPGRLYSQSKTDVDIAKTKINGINVASYASALQVCKYYWNHSFDSSIRYANKAVIISKQLDDDSLRSLANIYVALSYYHIDQLDSVLHFCNNSKKLSVKYPGLTAKANDILGITYRRLGDFEKALKYGELSSQLFLKARDSLNYATSLGNVSTTLQEMGHVSKAIDYSLSAAGILKALNDSFDLAKRYGTIANIYLDMDDLAKGMEYYNRGILLVDSTKHKGLYITFIFNMATVYHQLEQYDSAIYFYNISLNHYRRVNDREGVAIANQNIGLSLIEQSNYQEAIGYLQKAHRLFSELYTKRNVADVLSDLGLAYARAGIPDSAEFYMQNSIDTAIKYHLVREELKARKLLYSVYKTKGDINNALLNLEAYKKIEDSLFSEKTKEKIAALSLKYEAGLKDEKIKRLELNEKLARVSNRNHIIVLVSVAMLLILLSIALYYRKFTQNKMLKIKAELWEKEKAELDKELAFKKNQLSSHALHMTQKNSILQNIRKAVDTILPEVPDEIKSNIRALQMELNKSLRYDKDWELFSKYFNELNKDFYDKLTAINPELSPHDLRLAALLRMNMNIKEAAAVLNIAPDSVKTARYKLRKKLKLTTEDNLMKFVRDL